MSITKVSFSNGLIESYSFSNDAEPHPLMPKNFHLRAMEVLAQINLQCIWENQSSPDQETQNTQEK